MSCLYLNTANYVSIFKTVTGLFGPHEFITEAEEDR